MYPPVGNISDGEDMGRNLVALLSFINIYDFGYNADGVQSAAKIFFDTTPQSLKLEESATLVGMLKNSSLHNPIRRPEMVKIRRNVVFQQMLSEF